MKSPDHQVEVYAKSFRSTQHRVLSSYQSICICGWKGPVRAREVDADSDTEQHLKHKEVAE